jgi:hypothetical protein
LFVEVRAPEQQAGGHDDRPERVAQVVPEDVAWRDQVARWGRDGMPSTRRYVPSSVFWS